MSLKYLTPLLLLFIISCNSSSLNKESHETRKLPPIEIDSDPSYKALHCDVISIEPAKEHGSLGIAHVLTFIASNNTEYKLYIEKISEETKTNYLNEVCYLLLPIDVIQTLVINNTNKQSGIVFKLDAIISLKAPTS